MFLQICKDPVVSYVDVDLPDCSHTTADCHNGIKCDNCIVDEPGPPCVGSSHLQPHYNGKNEIHWNEPDCAYQGYKVTEEGDQCRQKGHEHIVDQGDAQSYCEITSAEPRLIRVAKLHLEELISWTAVDLQG